MCSAALQGANEDRFERLRAAQEESLRCGDELGASLVVDLDGVWSATKPVTKLAALMLVDRDELNIHAPVPIRFGIGYGQPQLDTLPDITDERICFWGWPDEQPTVSMNRRESA